MKRFFPNPRTFAAAACAVVAAAFSLAVAAPAQADTAILVGVNEYPKLGERYTLAGCVNDAKAMAVALKRYGFTKVVVLTDGEATRAGILSAIRKSNNRAGERFVFGFFGHGTNEGGRNAVLLPSDASPDASGVDITADELAAAVKAVPASGHTVVLDSCFSGGMMRSVPKDMRRLGVRQWKTRFYPRAGSVQMFAANRSAGDNSKDVARRKDKPNDPNSQSSGLCYAVAAAPNQPACEWESGGEVRGAFTYSLAKRLSGQRGETWEAVMTDVRAEMQDMLEGTQKPEVTPSFASKAVFGTGSGPAPTPPAPDNLWDVYNTDRQDARALNLVLDPNKTTFRQGSDDMTLEAMTGEGGYLVVLEKGTSGNINLLFPEKPNIEAARVAAGESTKVGEFTAEEAGTENFRAILFASKADAQLLLDAFTGPDAVERGGTVRMNRSAFKRALRMRDVKRTNNQPNGVKFKTADMSIEIVEGGGNDDAESSTSRRGSGRRGDGLIPPASARRTGGSGRRP